MVRSLIMLPVVVFALSARVAWADDASVAEEKLAKARETYSAAMSDIRNDVLKLLELKDAAERKKANPDLSKLKAFTAEKEALENNGEMPTWIDVRAKDRITRARATLVAALTETKAAYVRAKDDEKAAAVQAEIDQIKNGATRPADAAKFGNKYFKVFETDLSWHEAKKRCEQMGGHLAVIDSGKENEFVADLIKKSKVTEVWLGATDEKKKGEWVWVTGRKMTYSNWQPGQPNNRGGIEHYVIMNLTPEGKFQWGDRPNKSIAYKPGFVCQWD